MPRRQSLGQQMLERWAKIGCENATVGKNALKTCIGPGMQCYAGNGEYRQKRDTFLLYRIMCVKLSRVHFNLPRANSSFPSVNFNLSRKFQIFMCLH